MLVTHLYVDELAEVGKHHVHRIWGNDRVLQ